MQVHFEQQHSSALCTPTMKLSIHVMWLLTYSKVDNARTDGSYLDTVTALSLQKSRIVLYMNWTFIIENRLFLEVKFGTTNINTATLSGSLYTCNMKH